MTKLRVLHGMVGLLLFLVISCRDSGPSGTVSVPEPTEFRSAFFPMAVGNTWIYADTIVQTGDTTVTRDSLTIIGWKSDSLGIWWQFHHTVAGQISSFELMERNDSVFSRQYGGRGQSDFQFIGLEYLRPTGSDTVFFDSWVGGDVLVPRFAYRSIAPFMTPAGPFKGSVTTASYYTPDVHVIAPRIGFVGIERSDPLTGYSSRSRLMRLAIVQE